MSRVASTPYAQVFPAHADKFTVRQLKHTARTVTEVLRGALPLVRKDEDPEVFAL